MKILLKKAQIISPDSPFHGQRKDILIDKGIIVQIGEVESDQDFLLESRDLHVSIGWFDIGTRLGDPGFEHKEDLVSGLNAAVYGGFTDIACFPTTKPVVQSKENIHYLSSKAEPTPVSLHIIAAASENLESKSMTEIFDLHHAGAVAFSDGNHAISNSGLIVRLLQYLSQIGALLMLSADEKSLSSGGVMNEGVTSVFLGQKGMPALAEELAVSRNIALLEYAGGRLHLSKISSLKSVAMIRDAKKRGFNISCDVAVSNLVYDETHLTTFDTNFKTAPPLRTKSDQQALWEGLADGTIDLVITDHDPQDEESKKLEFDLAEFGTTQLETAFSLLNANVADRITLSDLLSTITIKPRKLLGLDIPKIEIGSKACLTVFDPRIEWTYSEKERKSKARNNPEFGNVLQGKALAIFNKGKFVDLREQK